jgi:putative endonuclease
VAAAHLGRQGLRVVARNVRSRLGEIDLVAEDGRTLVFVEVKARRGPAADPPQAAVDERKRARLVRLAQAYLARGGGERPCRFDVVAVTFDADDRPARVAHLRGAFSGDGWS